MNLVTRFLAARRDRLLMKLGCWLVCFSLVLGLMLPQQKADALVAELAIGSVAALAASYLCACGLPLVTQGMDRDALVSYVQRLIQEFLDTELGGITIQDWLGNVWDLAVIAGKLIMGRPLTEEFVGFAQWVVGKYGAQAGENVVYSDKSITFSDGSTYTLAGVPGPVSAGEYLSTSIFSLGTLVSYPGEIVVSDEVKILLSGSGTSLNVDFFYDNVSHKTSYSGRFLTGDFCFYLSSLGNVFLGFLILRDGTLYFECNLSAEVEQYSKAFIPANVVSSLISSTDLSIDRAESMSYIPEGIEAEQGIALDVGAAATMDLDLVLQGVLDDVLAGQLTSTMAAAGEEVVDPPAGEITDVDNLGLPALGAALTSRFPFSIPWDFFRAVQLLAAPAKAPYFEVDFMEPLADDVGGWQGDTTVILDFSEYAIIGQISRWTSTIGFCLMLAGATKRLIWTA